VNIPVQKYVYNKPMTDTTPPFDSDWWEHYTPPIGIRMSRANSICLGPAVTWSAVIFEVPAGSGSYYRVFWREIMHEGFPNEYAVFLTTQCDQDGNAIPPPGVSFSAGIAADVCASPPPPPPPPAIDMSDTFDDTPGTDLTVHTMTSGTGWLIPSGGSGFDIAADGTSTEAAGVDGSGFAWAWSEAFAPDGVVEALFHVDDPGGDQLVAIGRVTDEDNCYRAIADFSDNEWRLEKVVAGVVTTLDILTPIPTSFAHGDQLIIALECDGTTISAEFTGPLSPDIYDLGATDSSIVTGGKWGIGLRATGGPTCFTFIFTHH
jgi:hypothetical protein